MRFYWIGKKTGTVKAETNHSRWILTCWKKQIDHLFRIGHFPSFFSVLPGPQKGRRVSDPLDLCLKREGGLRRWWPCSKCAHWLQLRVTRTVQFNSVVQSCPTLCNPMNLSTPGLPVHHQLPESNQTHVHWVSDAIQPSHPLPFPSPPVLNLSQHQGLFK